MGGVCWFGRGVEKFAFEFVGCNFAVLCEGVSLLHLFVDGFCLFAFVQVIFVGPGEDKKCLWSKEAIGIFVGYLLIDG